MRHLVATLGAAAALSAPALARATPAVQVRDAAVRLLILPEQRSDLVVETVHGNPQLPLRVWSFAGRTHIDGDVGGRVQGCRTRRGEPGALISKLGYVAYDALPFVVVHTPMNARVFVGGAAWGNIGPSDILEFSNEGCGQWQVGTVRGAMKLSQAGVGVTRAGGAASAGLYAVGDGVITTREITGPVTAMSFGSSQIEIASVSGAFTARVAGAGQIRALAGRVGTMKAAVAGSGEVAFDGTADTLDASVIGSGDVSIASVTGAVRKQVIGQGQVKIGAPQAGEAAHAPLTTSPSARINPPPSGAGRDSAPIDLPPGSGRPARRNAPNRVPAPFRVYRR
jgi:hypothetical protein